MRLPLLRRRTTAALATMALAAITLTGCYGDTESAEDVTATSATLVAWGVPESTSTDFYFEWGTSTALGQRTDEQHPDDLEVGRVYPIHAPLSGLTPNTRYHYRLCGKERAESEFRCGNLRSFVTTTFANPPKRIIYLTTGPYAHADIKAVHVDGAFYGTGTGCALMKSANATLWDKVTDVCGTADGAHPAGMVLNPPDHGVNFWGTEVTKVGDRWVALTSGNRQYAGYTRGAIWVATATSPQGPWTWRDEALVFDQNATLIDPSIFADPLPGGKTWITWTHYRDVPTGSGNNQLMAQELDAADITRLKPGSAPVELLSTAVQPQDRELAYGRRIEEGQGVFTYAGRYYLHYAAGNWTYGTGGGGAPYTFNIAESRTSFPGRFTKRAAPDLRGGNGWRHPGHGSVFTDGGGNVWSATSPWKDGDSANRWVFLQKMTYHHDTKAFTVYDGILNTGQIGVPAP